MQVIKWFNNTYFEQNVVLGDATFMIAGSWNTRDEAWNISVYKSDETPLIEGKRLVLNEDVLKDVYDEDKPKGRLLVVPIANNLERIERDALGVDVDLIFVGDDEVL
jgi:hypothetical protein